jgi:1-phosphofructokinase
MGRHGALLVSAEGGPFAARAEPERFVSSVGAGDAALAGYLWAAERGEGPEGSLRAAVAAGAAAVSESAAGTLDRERFDRVLRSVELERL